MDGLGHGPETGDADPQAGAGGRTSVGSIGGGV